MLKLIARSALLRSAVGALGGVIFVGGALATWEARRGLGVGALVLGSALTAAFHLAERRAECAEGSEGFATSAFQRLATFLDPREPIGEGGYRPGRRVVGFGMLFAIVLILLRELGLLMLLGFVHGATGNPAPAWAALLAWFLTPVAAAATTGIAFVLIRQRAFLWREFQRITRASTLITLGYGLAYGRWRSPDLPEGSLAFSYGTGYILGTVVSVLFYGAVTACLCGAGYLLVNAALRIPYPVELQAGEEGEF